MGLDHIRNEIEHMRRQILRQQKEIQSLQRAGIRAGAADALLQRMQDKVDGLCVERDAWRARTAWRAKKIRRHR